MPTSALGILTAFAGTSSVLAAVTACIIDSVPLALAGLALAAAGACARAADTRSR